jgi:glycosyltransferase involved in cell wall biosynthesis
MRRPRALNRSEIDAAAETPAENGRLVRKPLSLTVVIPTVDDADRLGACLEPLRSAARRGIDLEVLVVDGGSADGTQEVLDRFARDEDGVAPIMATLLRAPGESRGARMQHGARVAKGEWLLFLRPESMLDRGWDATVVVFASEARNRDRAAVFNLAPLGKTAEVAAARRAFRIRNRWLGLPHGRQGLLIRRRHLSHIGGVPDLESGEDLVLTRRMGSRRTALFDVAVRVNLDADRPQLANALKLLLFSLRVPARWLQRLGD